VRPRHGHYDFAWAINDIVWVKPEFRHHGVGSALVAFWDAELARFGVQFVSVNSKVAHPALHGRWRNALRDDRDRAPEEAILMGIQAIVDPIIASIAATSARSVR